VVVGYATAADETTAVKSDLIKAAHAEFDAVAGKQPLIGHCDAEKEYAEPSRQGANRAS
jgi:hypothetical protein